MGSNYRKETKACPPAREAQFHRIFTLSGTIFTVRTLLPVCGRWNAATGMLLKIIFWILVVGVVYTYVGYAILAWIWIKLRKSRETGVRNPQALPSVALIIPAYNESGIIKEKIINSLSLDYPQGLLQVIVITDGCSDDTPSIAASFPGILHLHQPERKGKIASVNRAVPFASEKDVIVFSDANTMLNPEALVRLVSHYDDPRVGGVSGEKKVLLPQGADKGEEGAYWRYESTLKKLDASLYSLVGAAGELFSIRTSLYQPIPEDIILDDFFISMSVCKKGYLVKYEPGAFATEKPSLSITDERERKIRISAGAFQAIKRLGHLANPFRYGILGFQFLSRRLMRWIFCPLALPLILALNTWLILRQSQPDWLYQGLFLGQLFFYGCALAGWAIARAKGPRILVFSLPFYFVFMNLSVWQGFFRFINRRQSTIWKKASRV